MKKKDFEKNLSIEEPIMDPVRADINTSIQKLITDMISPSIVKITISSMIRAIAS